MFACFIFFKKLNAKFKVFVIGPLTLKEMMVEEDVCELEDSSALGVNSLIRCEYQTFLNLMLVPKPFQNGHSSSPYNCPLCPTRFRVYI